MLDDETVKNAGVVGAVLIGSIEKGMTFWTEEYKSVIIRSIELGFNARVLRTHGITDFTTVGDKVLLKWHKRYRPLTDEELLDKYGLKEE